MSAPHRPVLRATIGRLAVTGAATLATVFAVAPAALADDATVPDPATSDPATSETGESTPPPETEMGPDGPVGDVPAAEEEEAGPADEEAGPAEEEAGPAQEKGPVADAVEDIVIAPDFGTQKFRVGVQIDDGSFVPAGTTTVGSTFRISITDADGNVTVTTCTTTEENLDEETGQSFCPGDFDVNPIDLLSAAEAPPVVTDDDSFVFATADQQFLLEPGESATITQVGAAEGLTVSDDTVTIQPCETDEDSLVDVGFVFPDGALCTPADFENTPVKTTKVVFNNVGPLPVARDDEASTSEGKAVTIPVLRNDDSDDPEGEFGVDDPENGTVEIVGEGDAIEEPAPAPAPEGPAEERATAGAVNGSGSIAIRYTPRAGFSGTDQFTYELSNSNGSDTATVTVEVRGGAVVGTDVEDSDALLPDTGGSDATLLGYAALLLAGGGWLTLRGRRRADASID